MKISYAEILEIYKNYVEAEDNYGYTCFICHALHAQFGPDISTEKVLKGIAQDTYGSIYGWIKFYVASLGPSTLEQMFPDIGNKLGIVWCGPKIVKQMVHQNLRLSRNELRINVLTKLAEKNPNRRFDVNFF